MGAAHRSAARAWGARPVPFRTRKLSPIAPRVLRGQPVGGQGAADRWTAPSRTLELRRGRPRGLPLFCVVYTDICAQSVLGVFGLALVEGIVVVRGEVEPIFLLMLLSGGAQSVPGFCRHVYPDGSFCSLFPANQLRDVVSIKYTPPAGLYLIGDRAPLAFYRFVNVVLQFITGLLAETDEGIKMLCLQWTARFPRSYGLSKVYDHMCDSEQLGAQLIRL